MRKKNSFSGDDASTHSSQFVPINSPNNYSWVVKTFTNIEPTYTASIEKLRTYTLKIFQPSGLIHNKTQLMMRNGGRGSKHGISVFFRLENWYSHNPDPWHTTQNYRTEAQGRLPRTTNVGIILEKMGTRRLVSRAGQGRAVATKWEHVGRRVPICSNALPTFFQDSETWSNLGRNGNTPILEQIFTGCGSTRTVHSRFRK